MIDPEFEQAVEKSMDDIAAKAATNCQSAKLNANMGYSAHGECEWKHTICEWKTMQKPFRILILLGPKLFRGHLQNAPNFDGGAEGVPRGGQGWALRFAFNLRTDTRMPVTQSEPPRG